MLDYKLIEALARVIEEGGFKRAAEVLCLTQSAVSQRIRLLEETCGQIVLTRGTPPLPTKTGHELLKHYRQVRLLEEGLNTRTNDTPTTLSIGINGDSLASWFMAAVEPLLTSGLLFDLRVDDQEQTHRYLRDGEVVGCISTESAPTKGCRVVPLGATSYRMLSTAKFARSWFPAGLTQDAVQTAPAVHYNLKDRLHHDYCRRVLGKFPQDFPCHYVPDIEQLFKMVVKGFAYGMVPDWQSGKLRGRGKLVELRPDDPYEIQLYWHCWNLESEPLVRLTDRLIEVSAGVPE